MNFEPIIKARLNKFISSFDLNDSAEGIAFEKFVNYNILLNHQPDIFTGDYEMLDFVSVGGSNDMGIDGIAIKVNGLLISTTDDIKDIIDRYKRINVEFIFIQSKYKSHFNQGEFNNFLLGVKDFLQDEHHQPMNNKIAAFLDIKNYLLSEDIIILWDDIPSVRVYYVVMGTWQENPHQLGVDKQFRSDIEKMNTYDLKNIHYVDSHGLKQICDSNDNSFSISIDVVEILSLPAVNDVKNSCMALCTGEEYLKILTADDGVIRKMLFNDNVRDYQGETGINNEIQQTINQDPAKFILLNNGLTIVCDDYIQSNRKLVIKNPQIVNGCQTSNVLFRENFKGRDISQISITIKIISTDSLDITNQIVRGTNRQNIVYDEAFETTKQFHKELEEFFNAYNTDGIRLYYERRSRQYQHNPTIRQIQKVNLRSLIQSFVGMFLNKPDIAHRHESRLIKEFQNKIFLERHSKLPYYIAALTSYYLEDMFRRQARINKDLYTYKNHIAMIFRELVAGKCPELTDTKKIDQYCDILMKTLASQQDTEQKLEQSVEIFNNCRKIWVEQLHKSRFGIKDSIVFTKLILTQVGIATSTEVSTILEDSELRLAGTVLKVRLDKYEQYYGFISRIPEDIFFHSNMNKNLDFPNLEGKTVTYLVENPTKGLRPAAIDIKLAT